MASSRILAIDRVMERTPLRLSYRYVSQLAIVFALYFGAGKLGLAVPFTSSNVSPIWPAAGVAVAAVLIWGIQIAPAIAFAAFLVNFLTPVSTSVSVTIGLGNATSAVVAVYVLTRFPDFEVQLARLKDVLRFVIFAVVFATAVAASVGVTALTLAHTKAWSGYGSAWRIWWLGDAMGVVVVAPLLLTGPEMLRLCRGWRVLEACLTGNRGTPHICCYLRPMGSGSRRCIGIRSVSVCDVGCHPIPCGRGAVTSLLVAAVAEVLARDRFSGCIGSIR
jgi:hypothetical protein